MSFANLKSTRGSSIDKLVNAAQAVNEKTETKSYADDRFWKPTQDKAGNGYAVIRFLPAKEGEDLPWVRYWDHGFKGPSGLWYIENSLTSINQADPVSESNGLFWNSGREEDKQTARDRKRRLHYVSNVMVVSDSANPDAEGKVFLYKFGKKIFDKIMDVMQPSFADEKAINPFDFWEGANFKLKIRNVEGYRNYDKSEFDSPTSLSEDETKLEGIYQKQNSLQEFLDPKNFKTYSELKVKLGRVLGEEVNSGTMTIEDEQKLGDPAPASVEPVTAEQISSSEKKEDDTMSYFAKLAEAD